MIISRKLRGNHGFTLLEILVAMGILMMIVLMMATLFHQSSMAWDNGLRQAEMSIQARAAMSMIRKDLSQAVASEDYPCSFSGNIDIHVLDEFSPENAVNETRTVKHVKYSGKIYRYEAEVDRDLNDTGGKNAQLLGSVTSFKVTPSPNWNNSKTNLPPWVDITMTLEKSTIGAAGIRVWSNGRDKVFDTKDDKDKRLRTWHNP